MCPFVLRESSELKNEFFELARRILTFVPDWNDDSIGTNMMRVFSCKKPAQEALEQYKEQIKRRLNEESKIYRVSKSRDLQRTRSTNAEYNEATAPSVKCLNKALKEPSEIVFFEGGCYECTINDNRSRYNQSQLAYLIDLPSQDTVNRYDAIPLWIAPPGNHNVLFDQDNLPSRDRLRELLWNEVMIGVTPERVIPARGGLQAKRLQYSLKHIGATTINKSQGETLPQGLAIEITEQYSPWEKGQIVVVLSRTVTARLTVIVGNKEFAISKLWEIITISTQWTKYTAKVLNIISINPNEGQENHALFDYSTVYPFRLNDGQVLPTDRTGFVYCLISKKYHDQIYIGETSCLTQRLIQHNSGSGSRSTANIRYRPWAVSAFICCMSHMTKAERMSIENRWKIMIQDMIRQGRDDVLAWINVGEHIINMYNSGCTSEKLRFVRLISVTN